MRGGYSVVAVKSPGLSVVITSKNCSKVIPS